MFGYDSMVGVGLEMGGGQLKGVRFLFMVMKIFSTVVMAHISVNIFTSLIYAL